MTDNSMMQPNNLAAELAVLGSILIDPETFFLCREELPDGAKEFYIIRNGFVWAAFEKLSNDRQPIDYITVSAQLEKDGHLEEIGGNARLVTMITETPTSINAVAYAKLMHECYIRRRMIGSAGDIARLAYDVETDITEVAANTAHSLSDTVNLIRAGRSISIHDSVDAVYDDVCERSDSKETPGIPTPWIDYNTLLGGGIQPSDFNLIAGRPGMGKTSSLLQIARHAAEYKSGVNLHKKHVVIFSLEMPSKQLTLRMLSQISGIDYQLLRSGRIHEDDYPKFTSAVEELSSLEILIETIPGASPMQIRSRCEVLAGARKLDLICFDSLDRMHVDNGKRMGKKHEEVDYCANELKNIALDFNIPIWCAHQMNRGIEARGGEENKRPQLSDLNEGGEKPADGVMFIWHKKENGRIVSSSFVQEKQRNGPTGEVAILWLSQQTKFADVRRKD